MARIRTVKPEIWTDEKIVECSISARLLFIGLFNFANDKGCLERSPKRIKMQVFPADMIDCEPLIAELITHGLLSEYSVSGANYLYIRGFNKHQKINRPSTSKIPDPPLFTELTQEEVDKNNDDSMPNQALLSEDSVSAHLGLTDGRDDQEGMIRKGINPSLTHEENNVLQEQGNQFLPEPWDFEETPLGKFSLAQGWQPSADFRQRAAQWGVILPEPPYQATQLAEFIGYWQPEGKSFHQTQWEQKFARHVQRAGSPPGQAPAKRQSLDWDNTDWMEPIAGQVQEILGRQQS